MATSDFCLSDVAIRSGPDVFLSRRMTRQSRDSKDANEEDIGNLRWSFLDITSNFSTKTGERPKWGRGSVIVARTNNGLT